MKKLLIGAMIGAGVALLYAPASGRRTRAMIRDKATAMGNDVTEFVEKKKTHISNKMEGYKHKVRGMAEEMRDMMPGCDREMATSDPSI